MYNKIGDIFVVVIVVDIWRLDKNLGFIQRSRVGISIHAHEVTLQVRIPVGRDVCGLLFPREENDFSE